MSIENRICAHPRALRHARLPRNLDAGSAVIIDEAMIGAFDPIAVFCVAVVLLVSAAKPTAVLLPPVVLACKAEAPFATFWVPVVLLRSA